MFIPTLSIAIPTWNRASVLDKSLSQLLPQIDLFKNQIELIVSDNCSTDNTDAIIKKHKNEFKEVNFIHFKQTENTGYYGNFKKCKELASGKFFWLLSDNEFVNDGVIEIIIKTIHERNEINSIHLAEWDNFSKKFIFYKPQFKASFVTNDELITNAGYKLTLISSVIFTNDQTNNQNIFNDFKGNSFLGFALFMDSLKVNGTSVIINGLSLISYPTQISFNVFQSFTKDMRQCLDYAMKKGILNNEIENNLVNSFIYNLIQHHYLIYKIEGKIYGLNMGPLDKIDTLLESYFKKYVGYDKYLAPIRFSSINKLKLIRYRKRVFKKFKKLYTKLN